jgi:hypothetical protein
MRKLSATRTIAGIGALIWLAAAAFASETNSGEWTMHRSDKPGAVQLSLQGSRGAHHFQTSSDWAKSEFSGLDFSRAGKQEVRFAVTRDAGKFNFEGVLRDGAGAGSFQFSADARYVQEMKTLGFGGVADNQMAFALHDVSLGFARDMKNENLQDLDANKLLAFRIHGVTQKFIAGLKAAGLSERDSDNLVAFRIHGVTPEMVQRVRAAGYTPESKDLIAMRIHGATPEWMDDLQQRGYGQVPLDELVAFRIHDVSPDFISELQKLGYQHPKPDQLVAMRIHGVTPEYIGQLQARGVKDLTIDKLVTMKIHDID